MLFYERENLNFEEYLPDVTEKRAPDTKDLDDELETDFKKQCSVMWKGRPREPCLWKSPTQVIENDGNNWEEKEAFCRHTLQ